MSDPLYDREGERFSPLEWAGSPWSTRMQHGGPVNALFMEAAEATARERGLRVARLTVDLFSPVPMAPVERKTRFVREGRRIAALEITLEAEGQCVAGASAVLLRPDEAEGTRATRASVPPTGPEGIETVSMMPAAFREQLPPGFHWSLQIRMTGSSEAPAAWLHTPLDLCEGVALTPTQRLAALSDMTFGLGGRLQQRALGQPEVAPPTFINTDTTLYLERPPEGEWFSLQRAYLSGSDGVGHAQAELGDSRGRVGVSSQALLANRPASAG